MSDSELVKRQKVVSRAAKYMLDDLPLTAEQRVELYAAISYLRERARGIQTKPDASPGFVSRLTRNVAPLIRAHVLILAASRESRH